MIIRQFLAWTQHASASRRAEATVALTKAYLYGDLSADDAWEAKTALLALLDDPSPLVRRAMAETCAPSARTPRPLAVALSCDVAEVARPILAQSPVLTDADLVDAAALGCEATRELIAGRHHLSHAVSGALAEVGALDTLVALAVNPTARITAGRLLRMVERHGGEACLREALLARPDLPPEVRHAIGLVLARTLSAFVTECGWLGQDRCERMSRETGERVALDLCDGSGAAAVARLVRHLRASRQLNAGLILRAVLSGRSDFAQAALADLAGLDHAAVARAMREPKGVAALHHRAGLPGALLPAMQAALSAWQEAASGATALRGAGLSRRMIERAITACEAMPDPEMRAVTALLTRYETEAARDEAREAARAIVAQAAIRESARREAEAVDAAWRAALESQRRVAFESMAAEAVPFALGAAPVAVMETVGDIAVPDAETRAVAEPEFTREQRRDRALDDAFNPVGAILDALPDQILERFFAEREHVRKGAEPVAGVAPNAAAGAVLDEPEARLPAPYPVGHRAGAPGPDEALKIAA